MPNCRKYANLGYANFSLKGGVGLSLIRDHRSFSTVKQFFIFFLFSETTNKWFKN